MIEVYRRIGCPCDEIYLVARALRYFPPNSEIQIQVINDAGDQFQVTEILFQIAGFYAWRKHIRLEEVFVYGKG